MHTYPNDRRGAAHSFTVAVSVGLALLAALGFMLYQMSRPKGISYSTRSANVTDVELNGQSPSESAGASRSPRSNELFLYCAAGLRPAAEQVAKEYEREFGVKVLIQYGGSVSLLSQLQTSGIGDLFLAADASYTDFAFEKGLVQERIPLAMMRPVIAVPKGNPKGIRTIADLARPELRVVLGNPGQAAIGEMTRDLLTQSGDWEALKQQVTRNGAFKLTVPEVANDLKLGSADAGVVWDTTLARYPSLEAVRVPELDAGLSYVTVCVLASSRVPTDALRFARYLTARDRGLIAFEENGFETVEGDIWAEVPELVFFCGSVNRRAVESVISDFETREGVVVSTIYNGCGILTAQMKTIRDQNQGGGFPDTYMACDRYYLDTVQDWFQEDVDISDTQVVIAVPKGNPAEISSLQDLTKPGVRISIGQPDQCTIGVLTRQLLEQEGLYDAVMENVVTQTATSAMLIPTVTTGSVDATLAYATDTKAESNKVDAIVVASKAAQAIQPYAIARSSEYKNLGRRLYEALAASRQQFESAGFHFRIDESIQQPRTSRQAGEPQ